MSRLYSYFISRSARYYRNFFWIWISLVIMVSSIPNLNTPKISISGWTFRTDHLLHWLQYLALSFLMVSWQFKKLPFSLKKILVYTLAIGILIAVGDEYHQLLIPGRSFTYADMLSNTIGVITGVIVAGFFWHSAAKNLTH